MWINEFGSPEILAVRIGGQALIKYLPLESERNVAEGKSRQYY